ncbi:MAG: serine hydrolase [Planctomycetes bacterium]|nr:serine hydrolase [Planctomycetota bacterium]
MALKPFSLGAATLAALCTTLTAQIPDARENSAETGTYWNSGLTAAQITTLTNQGWRITDLQVEGTSPWTFTVAMVQNTGTYATGWWWYYDVSGATLSSLLSTNNARLIDIEPVDTGAGSTRFAAVMVSNAGVNAKGWDWVYDTTTAAIGTLTAQNKRIVDLEQYTINGVTRYAAVTINNTGADNRAWWYYYNVSSATMSSLLSTNNARVYDMDRNGSNFNVVMIGNSGQPKNWRYFGLTATQLTDNLSQIGARLIDVERYSTLLGTRYNAVLINNSNALSTRISEILRSNSDGHSGVYLKRSTGEVLGYINGDRPHEPASTLKTLHLLEAVRQVQLGTTNYSDLYRTYTNGGPNSCPSGSGAYVDESLSAVLSQMMNASDNNRTRTVTDNFGGFAQLNSRAAALGMDSTQVNHHIGCGTPPNVTTLRDIGQLHQRVIDGYLGAQRENFYGFMRQDYETGGYAEGQLGIVMDDEATLTGVSTTQLAAFKNRFRICFKKGGYGVNGLFYRCWGGYVKIPFVIGGTVVEKEYCVGSFVADATIEADAINACKLAAAEVLRDELHAALLTWENVPLAGVTTIGAGCGSPVCTQTYSGLPRLGTSPQYRLNNGYANSVALFAIGFSSTSANGAPLPLGLQPLGSLPGCNAYNDLALSDAVLTSATGYAAKNLALPSNISIAGAHYFTQWYAFDLAGSAPFKTTNGLRSNVGL